MNPDYSTNTEADAGRYEAGRGDPPDDTPTLAEVLAEEAQGYEDTGQDQGGAPEATYVCDGCMTRVTRAEVADLVDGEHVLCHRCYTDPAWWVTWGSVGPDHPITRWP